MARDTSTRFDGVYARHKRHCVEFRERDCSCGPSYWGKAWDRSAGRPVKTRMLSSPTAARNARADLIATIAAGGTPTSASMRVSRACERFVTAAKDGIALNKHGRRYKRSAWVDLDSCFENHVIPVIGTKRVGDVRRRDVQGIVDNAVSAGLSGSRVRSVVNAIRSLYAWLEDRELVFHDPAARVRLPLNDEKPREGVRGPAEMAERLESLPLADRLPLALAAFTGGRRSELKHALLEDVDFDLAVIYLGADEYARKSRAAQRAVPIPIRLMSLIRRSLLARGISWRDVAAHRSELLCPAIKVGGRNGGKLSFEALQDRVDEVWMGPERSDFPRRFARREIGDWRKRNPDKRVTPHGARHSFITWLDAAGVRPKVASYLAGHATTVARDGAAPITQQRYTHRLPGDLEKAREQLEAYLAAELASDGTTRSGTG